jgi:aldehyde dehydrogenase (NAD+)
MINLETLGLDMVNPGAAIGSKWLHSEKLISSYNPTDNSLLGQVEQTTTSQLDEIINQAHLAFLEWRDVPAPKRGELVRLIGDRLRKNKDALGTLVSIEMGKSKQEGDGEVQEMIDMADFAVGQSRMLYGKTMHSERVEHRMYEQWHPLGVVGVLTAFNFPVAVWAWNAFIAIICGNSVIWKPSSKTPICSVAVHKICAEVLKEHEYPAVLSLANFSDTELSKQFVDDKLIPLISFTGSTTVGQEIGQRVAQRFGRSLLELSGNNAVILDKGVDLALAIPSLVFAAVGTAGQRCTSLRRLIIHEDIYDLTITELVTAYSQLKLGDPTDQANHVGPLIDQAAVNSFIKAIDTVKAQNGRIIFGGEVISGAGFFVTPTIVEANSNWDNLEYPNQDCFNRDCNIVNIETFAPILYLMKFKTLDEAIKINNQVDYGLSSAIFTEDLHNAEYFLSACGSDCGIANVNIGTSGAEIGGAFGGEKATGGGREAGSDAWKSYMRRQTTTINYGRNLTLAQGIKFSI